MKQKAQKGFTLIELLVVIAIIGLLASVVLLALNSARAKSRDAKRVADIRQIMSGLELYFNDCNSYPVEGAAVILGNVNGSGAATTGGGKLFSGTPTCGDNSGSSAANGGIGDTAGGTEYIALLPAAPRPADNATGNVCNTTNNVYSYTGGATTYTITFCLGAQTGGLSAGVRTATQGGIN